MEDIYKRLAKHLDNLPGGFPGTETGIEIRILKKLFTPEEAEIACDLTMMLEPAESIAKRTGREPESLEPMLESMSKKGLILRSGKGDKKLYMAAQFVIGIWEYHVNDLDEELIKDVNEYVPYLMKEIWAKQKTKQLRVIPVSKSINAEMQVLPYQKAEEIINSQSKIVVAPCICRKEHKMTGKGCDGLLESCLIFGAGAYYYEGNGIGRSITKEEALEIIDKGLKQGLVLQPGNSKKPANICLCCGCCCQILKNLKSLDKPALAVHSDFTAVVDEENCVACGTCQDRCQMEAIEMEDTAAVDKDRCIGCGLCIPTCDFEAIRLKPKSDRMYEPPETIVDTYITIARERGLF